ncbi:MAG: hypothetical protein NT154_22210, partial [Verrucomicrobia bacterium]|nr:hypothetical protein [Verrucomicrobiota bacterium]
MEVIFASRRTLKVIQSLETLPAAEREATCAQIFAKAFQIHTNTYWVAMRSREDPSAPTNRQSMLSTLMAMCTAMFATAELGRSDMLLRQFAQLDEFQQQFERRLAAHGNSYPAGLIGVLKDLLKPDNRLQLNVLRLAVASGGGGNRQQLLARFDAECGHMDLRTEELTITRWDARTTAFDNRWPHMNSPVDTRGGVTKCVFYAWINPEDVEAHPGLQEGQIRKLRQIVGEAHATRQAAVAAPVETELKQLVDKYLPGCKVQYDGEGKPNTLSSPEGTFLDLKGASSVASAQPGYWSSPMMELLSRQSLKVESESDAVDVVKLLHALCYGPSFVKQKVYHPRAFEGGWLIEVDHDHKNYPGNVSFVHPYELLVDARINVTQFRQRCYTYLGSASVYSNTVVSVYEREKRVNGGSRYPEALRRELKEAWEKEKQQQTGKAKAQEELQRLQPAQDSSLRGTNSVGIEDPVEYLRMEALVTTLGRETWDQSVANLVTNVNQFLERSPFLPTGAMLGAEMDLLEMLSVRRAIKILNTLQALPMSQRVEKCRELFYRLLREYADAKERQLGLGSSPPEKPPYCTPHALCVAMFATAETGRRDILAEEFLRLDELRRRVENLMADNKAACSEVARKAGAPNYEFWKLWALRTCAPDARFQLNVLRLAVLRDPHAPDNLLKEIDAYCHSKDMT